MDVIQLHYFRTIVEQGSFSKAADTLYISRQGLTKIIKKLEAELDAQLFDITSFGVVPTVFGQSLYEKSDEYIKYHQDFLQELKKLRLKTSNELIIGLQSGFSEGFGKNFLADFIIQNNDLNIRVHSYVKEKIPQAMEQKEIPIWIITGQYNESIFHSLYSKKNKLFVLVSKTHPLALKKKIYMNDLEPYPLIGLTHDIGQKGRINTEINKNKLKMPDYFLNASDRNLTMKLIQSGVAISLNAGWHYTEYPGIIALPLADIQVEIDVHILLRNDIAVNPAIQSFIKYIADFHI